MERIVENKLVRDPYPNRTLFRKEERRLEKGGVAQWASAERMTQFRPTFISAQRGCSALLPQVVILGTERGLELLLAAAGGNCSLFKVQSADMKTLSLFSTCTRQAWLELCSIAILVGNIQGGYDEVHV